MDDFPRLGWGEAKAEINLLLHRIPFTAAAAALGDPQRITVGRSGTDGEAATVGEIDGRAVTVATRTAAGATQILSARPATPPEWRSVARPSPGVLWSRACPMLSPADVLRLAHSTAAERWRDAEADPDNPPLSAAELAKGLEARRVRLVRVSSGLSREAFAQRFRLDAGQLADWEWALTRPDAATVAYLTVIAREPEAVGRALGRRSADKRLTPWCLSKPRP